MKNINPNEHYGNWSREIFVLLVIGPDKDKDIDAIKTKLFAGTIIIK